MTIADTPKIDANFRFSVVLGNIKGSITIQEINK